MLLVANDGMSGASQHRTFRFENAVLTAALLIVVVDNENLKFIREAFHVKQRRCDATRVYEVETRGYPRRPFFCKDERTHKARLSGESFF